MLTDPVPDEESAEIREVVRKFLEQRIPVERVRALALEPAGYDRSDWDQMVEMGWLALGLPESAGGAGYGPLQQCVLFEELGRSLAGGPLLACAAFALPTLVACSGEGAAELIGRILDGQSVVAFVDGTRGGVIPRSRVGGGYELHGEVELVLDGQNADELVVATELHGGPAVLVTGATAPQTRVEPVPTIDPTRRHARVHFAGAPAHLLQPASEARLRAASDVRSVFLAAQMVGGAARAMEMTVDYLQTRHQFGRPIGAFQALKHRCADAAVDVSLARELVYAAAGTIDAEAWHDLRTAGPAALARASSVYQDVTGEAIQLHGGIGFTEEHDIGLYYRRAIVDRDLCGTPVELREEIAVAIGL